MKSYLSIFFILVPILLSGCVQQEILDDVELATGVGYEIGDDNRLEATAVVPIYQPEQPIKNKTYSESSELSKGIRDKLNMQSSKPFVSGKIEVALYSRELAEKGIKDILDSFQRDPSIGANIYLAIVDGDIKKQMQIQYGTLDNGSFLSDLIKHNFEHGILPKTNLHQFTKRYYSEGCDPVLPYLKMDGKVASIKGIALFKDDKYVDYLNTDDSVILKILREKSSTSTPFSVELEDNGGFVSVINVKSKRKFEVKNPMTDPTIKIKVETESIVREFTGEQLTSETIKQIESKVEEDFKKKAEEMIRKLQNLKIDPIGIGDQVTYRTRSWNKEKWDELYPDATIKVEVKVNIEESGIID